mgnify:CR=1 FL=1
MYKGNKKLIVQKDGANILLPEWRFVIKVTERILKARKQAS